MHTLINYVRSGQPDLTNRQMALMMLVYLTPGPHTVRGIAKGLGTDGSPSGRDQTRRRIVMFIGLVTGMLLPGVSCIDNSLHQERIHSTSETNPAIQHDHRD